MVPKRQAPKWGWSVAHIYNPRMLEGRGSSHGWLHASGESTAAVNKCCRYTVTNAQLSLIRRETLIPSREFAVCWLFPTHSQQ